MISISIIIASESARKRLNGNNKAQATANASDINYMIQHFSNSRYPRSTVTFIAVNLPIIFIKSPLVDDTIIYFFPSSLNGGRFSISKSPPLGKSTVINPFPTPDKTNTGWLLVITLPVGSPLFTVLESQH
jgi:hypothetical protein